MPTATTSTRAPTSSTGVRSCTVNADVSVAPGTDPPPPLALVGALVSQGVSPDCRTPHRHRADRPAARGCGGPRGVRRQPRQARVPADLGPDHDPRPLV